MDCPECGQSGLVMTAEDEAFNMSRLSEQKGFRKVGEKFSFMYRYTCSKCGPVYVKKDIRRK